MTEKHNKEVFASKKAVKEYGQAQELQTPEQAIINKYRHLIQGKAILDIGCGGGRTTGHLLALSERYVGIDYAPAMIDACKKKYTKGEFHVCDVRDLSMFKAESFDFILFSFNGIDYISHEDRLKSLDGIMRILSVPGMFVFSSHNGHDLSACVSPWRQLKFTANPAKLAKRMVKTAYCLYNHYQNKKYEMVTADYAIRNDCAHYYGLLVYYITSTQQTRQLLNAGFSDIETVDREGNFISAGSDDSRSPWLYYVARKNEPLR